MAQNTKITFISRAYTERESNKIVTLESGFYDHIPQFATIIVEKGFNLPEKCNGKKHLFWEPILKRNSTVEHQDQLIKISSVAHVRSEKRLLLQTCIYRQAYIYCLLLLLLKAEEQRTF